MVRVGQRYDLGGTMAQGASGREAGLAYGGDGNAQSVIEWTKGQNIKVITD